MIVRVVYLKNKSVAIIYPAPKCKRSMTEVFEKCMNNPVLRGLPYDDLDSSQLPQSREFRQAWEGKKGIGVYINSAKSKQIRHEWIIQRELSRLRGEKEKIERQQVIDNLGLPAQ